MTKATLEFDLDDHDDELDHRRAICALEVCLAVFDLDMWLRDQIKHHDRDALQPVRDRLHECLLNHGVYLEDLIC